VLIAEKQTSKYITIITILLPQWCFVLLSLSSLICITYRRSIWHHFYTRTYTLVLSQYYFCYITMITENCHWIPVLWNVDDGDYLYGVRCTVLHTTRSIDDMFFICRTLSYIILYSTQFRGKITQHSKAYTTHTYINIILYGHVSDEKGI